MVRLAANQTGVDNHKVSCNALEFINRHFCFDLITEISLVELTTKRQFSLEI